VGLYKHFFPSIDEEIFISTITETEEELLSQFKNKIIVDALNEIKAPTKRLEFLVRNLIFEKRFLDLSLLSKNEFGAPVLMDHSFNISFSHSYPFVCMYIHSKKKCGIDVEKVKDKIIRIAPKFLNEPEKEFTKNQSELITLVWSAKEVAFKIYQKGGVDFKEHIQLNFKENRLKGKFLKEDVKEISYQYLNFENHVLVYGVFE